MNLSFAFQPLSSAKVNTESGSRPVGPSQPLALVLNRLEYSLTFAYRVKSKLLNGPIFGEAYTIWGSYNNSKGKLITALEAPLMKQVLQNEDFSQSSYASIIEGLSVNEDDNPILIVYELKNDFVWPFD